MKTNTGLRKLNMKNYWYGREKDEPNYFLIGFVTEDHAKKVMIEKNLVEITIDKYLIV